MLRRLHLDGVLFAGIAAVLVVGLAALYSAVGQNGDLVVSQLIRMMAALAGMLVMAQVEPGFLRRTSPWVYGLGLVLLGLVLITGDVGKGAQRWLNIGVRFQPSEIMKIGLPMMLAWLLHERPLPPSFGMIAAALGLTLIPVAMIALQPEMIVPSHFSPVVGVENTVGGMQRMRDAVQFVHDAVVAGMNDGKTIYQLMDEIRLPAELELSQGHGKVSWAVKSIWEYYATWFKFESTTELYHVPTRAVYADVAEIAGADALIARAVEYRNSGQCLRSLHLLEMAMAAEPDNVGARAEETACLEVLLEEAQVLNNTYEVMWLEAAIDNNQELTGGR